jgi:hypothetical protein
VFLFFDRSTTLGPPTAWIVSRNLAGDRGLKTVRRLAMPGLTEDDIRNRAYALWKTAGEPAGQMDVFWYAAEKELLEERRANGHSADRSMAPISRH